jgi:hypothetical protein
VTLMAAELTGNDADPDGDALSVASVGNASNGTAALNPDGTVTFTPDAGFAGAAGFDYTVSDGQGGTDTARVDVTVEARSSDRHIAETGTLTLTHTAQTLTLERSYDNPVVMAHVATTNGMQPVNVRISEVSGDELTLQLQEPNHLNGAHVDETVNYMVVEAGSWVLPDGSLLEAGTMDSDKLSSEGFETVAFDAEFDAAPAVLSQVQSFNGRDFVTTRQRGTDADSFQFTMQEEEARNDGGHVTETLGWIAVEPGSGSIDGLEWRAGSTSGVTDATASVDLGASMADDAHVIAALSSFNGRDTAWARGNGSTDATFDVSVEEDTSRDSETWHIAETVDHFAFNQAGTVGAYDYDFFA